MAARPNTFVVFTTIPTASLAKFQTSKRLAVPILSDEDLAIYQRALETTVDAVNARIVSYNQTEQHGVSMKTLFWHNAVRKSAKRTRRGQTKHVIRNHFAHLYDGLQAIQNCGLPKCTNCF